MGNMKLNKIEKEVIVLKAVIELIDEMVNKEVLEVVGKDPDSNIYFKTSTHQKFFNILLVDFLSKPDEKFINSKSYLSALKGICKFPSFNINNSITFLDKATKEFSNWLEKEIIVKRVYLSTIDLKTDLSIKRIEFIKICGNISKHNFTRLSRVAKDLKKIFERNNIPIKEEDVFLIIGDFYDWFHNDIFSYHSSAIAEFLNNIRWGIHEYLQPEYQHSITFYYKGNFRKYNYKYPEDLHNDFAKYCYWELMNSIRLEPFIKKFKVTKYLKMRY